MIKSSDLIRLLKDNSINFSKEELESIIENELKKEESEMDAELIECCIDALNEINAPKTETRKKRSYAKFISFAAVAAVLILINFTLLPVLAKKSAPVTELSDSTVVAENSESSVTQKEENASTDESKPSQKPEENTSDNTTTSLKNEESDSLKKPSDNKGDATSVPEGIRDKLNKKGFMNIALPKEVIKRGKETSVEYKSNSAVFSSVANGKNLKITITKTQKNSSSTTFKTEENLSSASVTTNGISVLITNKNSISTILYYSSDNSYKITLNSTLEEAIEIAKTITV